MTKRRHPDLGPAHLLMGTIGGIPIYADEAPKGSMYIIATRSESERVKLREIFGDDYIEGVAVTNIGTELDDAG